MALRAYTSPGVSVAETISPALAPLIAAPSVICLVGAASGFQSATERLILSGTDPTTLRYTGVNLNSVVVVDPIVGTTTDPGSYTVTTGTDPDSSVTGDEPALLKRVAAPTTAPTANTGAGTLTGTYRYAVSFVNSNGETGLGPASSDLVLSNQGGDLSDLPIDNSAGNTTSARNIYRAKIVGGNVGNYHLVATYPDNTTTDHLDNVDDVTAGANQLPANGISDGGTVQISYQYTNIDYYEPTFFADYDDIIDKYGPPFDGDGNISSPLSFAARLAFQNGASEIMALAAVSGSDADIGDSLAKLENEDSVRFVTIVSGSAGAHTELVAHVTNMNSQGKYRQAILGRDGVDTPTPGATLRSAAQGLNNEAAILLSPASFVMENPVTGHSVNIGSQYAAAGVAGMFSARDVQVSLTRKTLGGFTGLADKRTGTEQALDSAAGLFVIVDRGGVLQVRHQVTTAVQNVNTAEASVVRAKYDMAHRVRDVLEGAVVGQTLPLADVPITVQSAIEGILEQLVVEGAISRYANIKARVLDTDPTTVEARYEYRPAYPINNIIVRFTINANTGDTTLETL